MTKKILSIVKLPPNSLSIVLVDSLQEFAIFLSICLMATHGGRIGMVDVDVSKMINLNRSIYYLAAFLAVAFVFILRWRKYIAISIGIAMGLIGSIIIMFSKNNLLMFRTGMMLLFLLGSVKTIMPNIQVIECKGDQRHISRSIAMSYWLLNLCCIVNDYTMPKVYHAGNAEYCFMMPFICVSMAGLIFFLRRKSYIFRDHHEEKNNFFKIFLFFIKNKIKSTPIKSMKVSVGEIRDFISTMSLGRLFFVSIMFYACYEQMHSSLVQHYAKMDLKVGSFEFIPAQFHAIQPVCVILMVPIFRTLILPFFEKRKKLILIENKFNLGLYFLATAFFFLTFLELLIHFGYKPSILWDILTNIFMTIGEMCGLTYGIEMCVIRSKDRYRVMTVGMVFLCGGIGNILGFLIGNMFKGISYTYFFVFAMIACVSIIAFKKHRTYHQKDILHNES